MHDDVLVAMSKNLEHLRDRALTLNTFDMTHDECLQLVAPPQHYELLRSAAEVANVRA